MASSSPAPADTAPQFPPSYAAASAYQLVPHTYKADDFLPRPREAIKIRLPHPIAGPGSAQGSSHNSSDYYPASTTRHRQNYHTAFVMDASLDLRGRVINLKLWPTPSYSGAIGEGFSSPIAYVASLDKQRRDRHIPVPFTGRAGVPVPETPGNFGPPLVIGGYQDRQPSWVLLDLQSATLRFTTKWKSFSPPVLLSIDESVRLMDQFERLNSNDYNIRNSIPNSLPPPGPDPTNPSTHDRHPRGPHSGAAPPGAAPAPAGSRDTQHAGMQHQLVSDFRADFWSGFEHFPPLVIAESESGDDSADEQEGPLSYARLLSPYSKFYRGNVQQQDKEATRNSELRMMRWVEDVARRM